MLLDHRLITMHLLITIMALSASPSEILLEMLLAAVKKDCGVPLKTLTPMVSMLSRIVGGDETEIEHFPWQVLMRFHNKKATPKAEWEYRCGGSILSPKFVMTAAHCILADEREPIRPNLYRIEAGTNDVNDREAPKFKVDKIHIHPDNELKGNRADYAIVELQGKGIPLKGSSKARAICLPDADDIDSFKQGTKFIASGWGTTDANLEDPTYPKTLQYIEIPFVPRKKCNEIYGKAVIKTTTHEVYSNEICAGELKNGGYAGACFGDSGGPLAWRDPATSIYKLIGVASWGENCGEYKHLKKTPGRYAGLPDALDWIKEVTGLD